MIIREMQLSDLDRVLEIATNTLKNPWSKEAFIDELNNRQICFMFVSCQDDVILGFYGFQVKFDTVDFTLIAVDIPYQNKGIGMVMIEDALKRIKKVEEATRIILEVRESNLIAQKLYQKFDFKKIDIRKKYYSDQEDALILLRNLK